MIIDCISDLHGSYPDLEGGDLLIVAGDLTASDQEAQYDDFWRWLCYQNYRRKVVIAGNHDGFLAENPDHLMDGGDDISYLCDSGTEFEGLKIWGAPWTQWFHGVNPHCKAFMKASGKLKKHWDMIPDDTDILVTHGPAQGYLDSCFDRRTGDVRHVGCRDLTFRMHELPKCRLHVFGHIHEGYGTAYIPNVEEGEPGFYRVNASLVNRDYEFVNKRIRVIL